MSAAVIEMPHTPDLESKALSIPQQAEQLLVRDQASYETAATFLRDVVAPLHREIRDTFGPICDAAFDAHRKATATRKRFLDPVEHAQSLLKERIGAYEIEQKRLAEEQRRKAQEEAERLAAEIVEAEIEAAEARGATLEEVSAIAATPFVVPAPTPVTPLQFQRIAGITARSTYKAEADLEKVVKAAAGGNALALSVLAVDQVKLNALARAQGAQLQRLIPGITVVQCASVSARRK